MPGQGQEFVEVECTVTHETEAAVKCVTSRTTVWVPKSQLRDQVKQIPSGGPITIEVPEWLAIEKGLV